ncbi:tetratricopeptide repeat-containing glycosyltransferase family protein [Paraburkholderia sp. C35]|uniref:tetratricopeptide repeat-containing glycosyltransferase family protein n=1 Tax=Paraburkholderia sp. C35 TaxID=2126993 RepID=UPI000D68793E|nr:tetratricopeptide repeat-containing glycosyltransferase family protein [Paraburkholderia sp. C35]
MSPTFASFLTFLRYAVQAQADNDARARALWLEAASHLQPMDGVSIDRLMLDLLAQQDTAQAVALVETVAQLEPHSAAASMRAGYALQMANRHGDALAPYRHALSLDPAFPQLRKNLAIALNLTGGDVEEERQLLEAAVAADPSDFDLWINLMSARRACFDLDGALAAARRAVELDADSAVAHGNLAQALKEAQQWDEAQTHAAAACARAPDNASLQTSLGVLHLLRGNYADGWLAHEARWNDPASMLTSGRPQFGKPQWRGESLEGKTLLVWGEQGMGDVLQFCRFIPLLAQRVHREGGHIVWNSFPQMGALLPRSFGMHVDVYSAAREIDALPPFDFELPLVSAPLMLGTRVDSIPSGVPYLHADDARRNAWRARLADEKRLKVGLAWTGSLNHGRNRFRRVGTQRYAQAFRDIEGVAAYSLQPGATTDVEAARAAGLPIADFTNEWRDFDDTAAFVSELDLVISVCTSAAHLASALGQRTWVLLDVNPYWTWMTDRRDSPWYPTATLYRQREFAQWQPVMDEVARDLRALAAEPRVNDAG